MVTPSDSLEKFVLDRGGTSIQLLLVFEVIQVDFHPF
jgi:hypothetical protein